VTSRLFVAVVPPPDVIEHLEEFATPRRSRDDPLRWSDPQRWHITIAFMPAASESRYDNLAERLEAAATRRSPFELAIGGAGAFPDPIRAKVLVACITGDLDELNRLSAGARTAASTSGIAVDGGSFRPHLTLARVNPPIEASRWLRIFDLYRGPSWRVTEIELIESHLGGGSRRKTSHAEHQVREVFQLG
jgi:2'-5' RNA ligase